jgi:hypothetical protein
VIGAMRAAAPIAVLVAACSGTIEPAEPAEPAPRADAPVVQSAAPMPLRRLGRREYDNTIRDLLGDATHPAAGFPREPLGDSGFASPAAVSVLDAQLQIEAVEGLARTAVTRLPSLLACDACGADEPAAVARFIETFGRRAYRRPLGAEEVAELQALFTMSRMDLGFDLATSVGAVLQAMLLSPSFLYHWEAGGTAPAHEGGLLVLSPYQLASRLSYALWGSMPDDELLDAARDGRLATAEQVALQARRLLADRTRVADTLADFHRQWLRADALGDVEKDRKLYPEFNDKLAAAMTDELSAVVAAVVLDGDGRLETLLTSPVGFVDESLAKLYGVSGVKGAALRRVELDRTQRAGLLTGTAFLASNSGPDGSHPALRGQAIYRQVLCGEIPPPPAEVPPPPPSAPALSTRERFAQHAENPCAGCHKLFDPLGFGLENYDAVGRVRTLDGGKPVDASGAVIAPSGAVLGFGGGVELARAIAGTPDVRRCVARQWFRYALGRRDADADAGSFETAYRAFARADFDLRALLLAVVQTASFRYRAASPGEVN